MNEARDFNPADSSVAKLAFNKELRIYSLNIWLNKLSEKTFSLRVNSHKMLYGILKGMEFKLFSADTFFLNVPAVQRWKWDWTQQDLITFMLEGGFKPLARDFPDAQTHYKMIFIRQDLADLPEVKKETKKFLTRFDENEPEEEKASRWGKKKK